MQRILIRYWHSLKKQNSKLVIIESIIITATAMYIFFTTHKIIPFIITAIILIIVTVNLFYKAYTKTLRLLELLIFIVVIVLILGIFVPRLEHQPIPMSHINCMSNLKQLGTALYTYASVNNDYFPDRDGDAGLDMLRQQNYLTDYGIYLCPATSDSTPKSGLVKSSYIYHGGLTTSAPEKTILMEDKPGNHKGYRNYLYCNGAVKGIKDPNYHDPSKDIVIKYLFRLLGWLR